MIPRFFLVKCFKFTVAHSDVVEQEGCSYLMLSLICFFFLNLDYIVWFWENGFK